jgi:large subunit ribosomal protein L37Ae
MAKRTKKVGIVGKYGTRYGSALRKIIKKFELQQHAKYVCPFCGKVLFIVMQTAVRRQAVGIWKCKGCKVSYAGGAYELSTTVAATAKITMNRLKKLIDDAQKPNEIVVEEDKQKKKDQKDAPRERKPKEGKAPREPKEGKDTKDTKESKVERPAGDKKDKKVEPVADKNDKKQSKK